MSPIISIIIPAYNSRATIAQALDSVAAQSFSDIEIIVVDDASVDGTVKAAEAACREAGGKWRVISLPENAGPAGARNRGIREAKGEWIAFLDADDAWLPSKLETQLRLAEEDPEVVMWCGRVSSKDNAEPGAPFPDPCHPCNQRSFPSLGYLQLSDFAIRNPVATSTVLVRKDTLIEAGMFDEQFRGPEDYDLWIRVASRVKEAGKRIGLIEAPLVRYSCASGSLSMDERRFLPEVLRVIDKAYAVGGCLNGVSRKRKAVAFQLLQAAWMACERGDGLEPARLFFRSFLLWPVSFRPEYNAHLVRTKLAIYILKKTVLDRTR